MENGKYTEREAVLSLERKGCKINLFDKEIFISKKVLLGNRSLGRLGFLKWYKKYKIIREINAEQN